MTFDSPPTSVALPPSHACSGEMTCICDHCTAERVRRVKWGVRRPPKQPWESDRREIEKAA